MRRLGRGSVARYGGGLLVGLAALFASPAAVAHPARSMQPHYCGMVKGAPWTIRIGKATGGFVTKRGDMYAVSSGWEVVGCTYARRMAARLTHVAATRLRDVRFPTLHLTCSGGSPKDVGPLAVFGWCGRLRKGSEIASMVSFFWSPSGDPGQ
jgi:hypothetical protein